MSSYTFKRHTKSCCCCCCCCSASCAFVVSFPTDRIFIRKYIWQLVFKLKFQVREPQHLTPENLCRPRNFCMCPSTGPICYHLRHSDRCELVIQNGRPILLTFHCVLSCEVKKRFFPKCGSEELRFPCIPLHVNYCPKRSDVLVKRALK